jgi:hypothetical protein
MRFSRRAVISASLGSALGGCFGQYRFGSGVAGPVRADQEGRPRGRAPFQMFSTQAGAIASFRTPGGNDILSGVEPNPFGTTSTHIIERGDLVFAVDATFTGQGYSDPPHPEQYQAIAARFNSVFSFQLPLTKKIFVFNAERAFPSWVNIASTSSSTVASAVSACQGWVAAIRSALPDSLIGWYSMPSNARHDRTLLQLQTLTPLQDPLIKDLDMVMPEIYFWRNNDFTDRSTFNSQFGTFRTKLQYIRDRYPHKLLIPVWWDEFLVVVEYQARASDEAPCPVTASGNQQYLTYPTYNRIGAPVCGLPALSLTQANDLLQMFYDVGCDGCMMFGYHTAVGAYWTDANRAGLRSMLDFAAALNGAVPVGNHTATFLQDKGPFAP